MTGSPHQGARPVRISICIPTYNRARHLANCLESIRCNDASGIDFEVCVSDNGSTDHTAEVVRMAQSTLPIKYHRNDSNRGIPANFLNVVSMATGEFAWLVGDDDLLMPDALKTLSALLTKHPTVDHFYVNAFHLSTEYVDGFSAPFQTTDLPHKMAPFSAMKGDRELPFLDMINPELSFDFLGGMFLSVFRRERWRTHASVLDPAALADMRVFSHFDNTFPHVKIFANALASSRAYFHERPLIVCLTGAREWAPMYPMVRSVRLVEALAEYRANGLPLVQYLRCRNFALRTFIPDLAYTWVNGDAAGWQYLRPLKLVLANCWYPNFYLSVVYYIARKTQERIAAARTGEPETGPRSEPSASEPL